MLPAPARAGIRMHDYDGNHADSRYIALANDPKYASVGAISIGTVTVNPNTDNRTFASVILISPKWVLTAAHVTQVAGGATLNFGGDMWYNGATYTSNTYFSHPGWPGGLTTSGNDLGLVRLNTSVANVAPAARYFLANEISKLGTSVGYGLGGTGLTGADSLTYPAGTKRAVQNDIDVFGPSFTYGTGIMASDFDDPTGGVTGPFGATLPRDLEGSIAGGDSGGGNFIEVNGRAYLAGVHSFLSSYINGHPDGHYGDFYASTRLSQYNSWIDDNTTHGWKTNASGSFSTNTNWNLGTLTLNVNPVADDIAGFNVIGSYTVTFNGATQNNYQLLSRAGDVTLNLNGSTYNLTSASYDGGLVVGRYSGNNASITLTGGTVAATGDAIVGQLTGSNGRITIGNNASLNINGDAYVGGANYGAGGAGTITLQAASSTLKVNGTLRVLPTGTITYSAGTLNAGTLDIAGRVNVVTGANKVVQTKKVLFSGTGKLDLNDNDMIVDYSSLSPIDDIRGFILSGFSNGLQTGNGIITTRAKTSPNGGETGKTRLGFGEASALSLTSFDGITVDSTAVLVKYTYAGDATLDGKVDITDLYKLATAWNTSGYWTSGDFNYDGVINAVDLSLLSLNWQAGTTGALGPDVGLSTALTSLGLPLVAVPEPASVGLLTLAGIAMLRRRRR